MNHDPRLIVSNLQEEFISIQRVSMGPHSTDGSESDYRSRDCELYPCLVPYFRWIDCEMISMVILLLPADSRRVVGSYTKYWLTALDTLAQEKVWLGELTVPP